MVTHQRGRLPSSLILLPLSFVMNLIIAAVAFLSPLSSAAENVEPNIVLIFVDDMGYGDPGCYGGRDIPTPNIDGLAARGVRFTDGYVTAPVCGPSRVGLLTGAYQQRFGCYWNEDLWQKYGLRLPDGHKLLPQALRAEGYVTGHIGKWNITPDAKPYVDEAHDVMCWKGAYFPDATGKYLGVDGPDFRVEQHGWGPQRPDDEYLTDRLTRHAIDFIDRQAGHPFFLYLAYNAPHTPLQAKGAYRERFAHLQDEPNGLYAGMVASLDEGIGRVLDKLSETGLEQDTLVALVSDNGPARGADYLSGWQEEWPEETLLGSAGPLAGHKAQLQEGGIREPFILCWPGHLAAGKVYRRPVSTLDLYPTFCAAANIGIPDGTDLDGVNLLPYLNDGATGDPHKALFWKTHNASAVRKGDMKLVIEPWGKRRLFDLSNDVGETRDLSRENPDIVKRLEQVLTDWAEPFPPAVSERDKRKG